MDPLTQTLVGASLADSKLGRRTRLAVPALVVGANLPDMDVFAYFRGSDFALGFRRGITHGVPALLVLAVLLALVLWLWGRWRDPGASHPTLSFPWLLGLSALAVVSHPALDWLNTYGMRWGLPFSGAWSYGDSVFIVEPWLWGLLGGVWLLRRRPSLGLTLGLALLAALLVWFVARRASGYLPLLLVVLGTLALLLLWRPKAVARNPTAWSHAALAVAATLVVGLIALHQITARRVASALPPLGLATARVALVGPKPATPHTWDVVLRDGDHYRFGTWTWTADPALTLAPDRLPAADTHPLWPQIQATGQLPGFLTWVRLPWIEVELDPAGTAAYVMDARYTRSRAAGFGAARFELDVGGRP